MPKLPTMIPVSELRQDTASVLATVRRSSSPVVITQRGRAAAVLMSVSEYERAEDERELLHLLARGERDIEANRGHDLADVMRDADELLDAQDT